MVIILVVIAANTNTVFVLSLKPPCDDKRRSQTVISSDLLGPYSTNRRSGQKNQRLRVDIVT